MSATAPEQEGITQLSQVKTAMQSLSHDHREIVILICVKGMRYSEVSELLNIPIGTVRSRLARAREQLQAIMDPPPTNHKLQAFQAAAPANMNMPAVPAYIASRALQSR
jgi:DNA-directed RNA polymerase specialized sigma24 family protein